MQLEHVEALLAEVEQTTIPNEEALEQFRLRFISKKGVMGELFAAFREVPNDQKKAYGQTLNRLKAAAEEKFRTGREAAQNAAEQQMGQNIDVSLPPAPEAQGSIHPIRQVQREIIRIFERMGFNLSTGPEIETDWHNFTALNFPENHPAREMQDTFFIERNPDLVLRTHTSSVQVRVMENEKPPLRTLSVGRVFRNETISARAHCMFHQIEGLYVNEGVSFVDLKQTLYHFVRQLFGADTKIRFRPSYFPFTEPSAEVDISCHICGGKGCNICKHTGWVEIGGSGMVHPNVLKNGGIDPEKYTGFAFGMGVERITMLLHQINDLRLFTENDVRFLRQFQGV